MLRLTLRNLSANKGRFAMTTFAVVLGVGFVVASFVLSDGLRSTFDDLSEEITSGTDLVIRPVSDFGEPLPLSDSLVAEIQMIDGVASAGAFVEAPENSVQPIKSDGTTISTSGPPQLMFSWMEDPALGSFALVDGSAPDEPGEFAMDIDAASTHGFVLGETYDLITPIGIAANYELVGTTSFGAENATVGATLMHVSLSEAQTLFGVEGSVDSIPVRLKSGADAATTTEAIATRLGDISAEVVDNATITTEQSDQFNQNINIIGNVLLGFAIVSLFVSIFIIYNTFAIVLGQRIREIGLLRAIGANATQIRRSILGESLIVEAVASVIGIAAGVGIAAGLIALFAALGLDLPDSPTILATRTIVLALILGIGVTVISAIAPARTAGAVSPIQAMRDGANAGGGGSGLRISAGMTTIGAGVAFGVYGLFVDIGSTLGLVMVLGAAAILIFLGVATTAPGVVGPVTRVLGWPGARLLGQAGYLARENAGRNPKRTATTGAALMIGLSLVTAGYVIGESIKARLGDLIAESVTADYVIVDENDGALTPTLADDLANTENFAAVTGIRYDNVRFGSEIREITALDLGSVEQLFNLDVASGELPSSAADDVVVIHSDLATEMGVAVGDTITTEFVSGTVKELSVAAIYNDGTIFGDPLVPDQVFDDAGATNFDDWVAARLAAGVSTTDVAPAIAQLQARYPQVSIDTASEFQQGFEDAIDQSLVVINALLALAVVIALIGIANTLALSVHERTREIGLLRAVGMTRRQTRRMVRWEAALVALFGAVLGVTVGLVFGWGVVNALPGEDFGGSLAIPGIAIVRVVVIATMATLIAAWLPARRAGRLNVLDAISHS